MLEFINKYRKDIIIPSAVLLVICIVIPLALALTNMITEKRIAELEIENRNKTMSQLIDADNFVVGTYKDADTGEGFEYYIAENDGNTEGYVFITSDKGYGGDVSVMTAVETDGTVMAVAILDVSNETPGLGQNADKESFYSQYAGKKSGISLLKNGADSENNEINAVTGATVTSAAVTRAVNKALDNYNELYAGLGGEAE